MAGIKGLGLAGKSALGFGVAGAGYGAMQGLTGGADSGQEQSGWAKKLLWDNDKSTLRNIAGHALNVGMFVPGIGWGAKILGSAALAGGDMMGFGSKAQPQDNTQEFNNLMFGGGSGPGGGMMHTSGNMLRPF